MATYLFFQFLIRFASNPYSLAQFFLKNSLVPRLVRMTQALRKLNMSPKLRKMTFLHKNGPFSPKFPFSTKSSFLKKKFDP